MKLLENKNILVGVTGSIAVYKTIELVRLYKKSGADVRVIMSLSAKKFVNPITFETISQNKVIDDENEDWSTKTDNNHIAIGKWADIFVIAPTTASTVNKLSNGYADNILTSTVLAYSKVKLIAPAANTNMIQNPLTKKSLENLQLCNFKLINSISKELACKDIGDGAMAEVEDIFNITVKELLKDDYWSGRDVVLNGGGTIEKIDDVRYISNFSSGKMAASLATALYYCGANVTLVTTKDIKVPKEINIFKVQSSLEMFECCTSALEDTKGSKKPYFFGVAAVSDYTPSVVKIGKLKKDQIGNEWSLKLKKNIDILQSIKKENIYTIGFKAEMDKTTAKQNALNMLKKKTLDGVCLNILDKDNSFGGDENFLEVITKEGSTIINTALKLEVSLKLLELLKGKFSE